MLQEIASLRQIIEKELPEITSLKMLEEFRLRHLVKKGTLQGLTDRLRDVPKEEKPQVGKELNLLKKSVEERFKEFVEKFENETPESELIDVTLPGRKRFTGSTHPIRQTLDEVVAIFKSMGFAVAEGPDIEDDYHNFEALNFPPDHPARDMQDTFFIEPEKGVLLRTHTSPVQVRMMQNAAPPIRSIMPGRVYRNESITARSLAEFHQIEGLYIDKKVSLADLKATLITFAKKMYGEDSKFRFRPSFFPFTEPSAELDISCYLCKGKGCRMCKYSGWLEIAGCGMVHPNVLKASNIDPEEYSGYAFGFGIERVTALRTGIDDIRLLYENDVRVLEQFS
jgi:phenylalanyl-tRNA synthetase alpha chain